jgi:hypothetical protein
MSLSKRAISTLLDLVEIKLSTIQIFDREDAREQALLETCRDELEAMARDPAAMVAAKLNGRAKAPRRATAH